jgi:hypothetical protein
MKLARIVFGAAGLYGLVVLVPDYFLEASIGRADPPAITHPEYFYGFVGVALAWQIAFLLIARDPGRYRRLMPVAVLEKMSFGLPAIALFADTAGRISVQMLTFGLIDLSWATSFLIAYLSVGSSSGNGTRKSNRSVPQAEPRFDV